jgi:hypothetical protein
VSADRPAAGQPGQIGLIELQEGASVRSYAYRQQYPRSISTAPWIGSSELQVASGVSHLLVGERRIVVPGHGRLIVAWKSPPTGNRGLRPLIVAVGPNGSELSRIGPHDRMDSYTWAKFTASRTGTKNLLIRRDLQLRPLPAHSPVELAKHYSLMRSGRQY